MLKHFKYSLSHGKELGVLWQEVEDAVAKKISKSHNTARKKKEVAAALKHFNEAFGELFKDGSPESLLKLLSLS